MMHQIWNRLQLMVAQGAGVLVGKYKIQVKVLDNETLDNVDRIEAYGLSTHPKSGCQAFIVFPSGDRSHGLCLIQADKRYQLTLEDGEVALHDDQGQMVHLTRSGIVMDGGGKPITLKNTPKVHMDTALLEVTGEIVDRSDSGGSSMSHIRTVYNTHTHNDPQGGSVAAPNQGM